MHGSMRSTRRQVNPYYNKTFPASWNKKTPPKDHTYLSVSARGERAIRQLRE